MHNSTVATDMPIEIKAHGKQAAVQLAINQENLSRIRKIPGHHEWRGNLLIFEPSAPNLDFMRQAFPEAAWDERTRRYCQQADTIRAKAVPPPLTLPDFPFKTKPFEHQDKVFRSSRDRKFYALLMEQGTGKTKVTLDTAAWLYAQGLIRGLVIIAPNGVHRNWVGNEIPTHLPDFCKANSAYWTSAKGEKSIRNVLQDNREEGLRILAFNVEAFSHAKVIKYVENFLLTTPSLVVVDESTTIKTPGAKRTKSVLKIGKIAVYKRILTGTPITRGPLDAYTQFNFLDDSILGFGSYYSFRNHFAVLKDLPGKKYHGRPVQVVVGYQNLEDLKRLIEPHSFRVLKKECLDLPPKVYQRQYFEMSEAQWKHYDDMVKNIMTEFEGRRIAAPLAMTRLMRLHQIACGFLPPEDPDKDVGVAISENNPRLTCLMETLENVEGKAIIFADYRFSLREIWTALAARYGKDALVAYHGKIKPDDRVLAIDRFQKDPSVRFFIAQTDAAAKGLTLTAATTVIYYSNDYNLENRVQSEDRPHRIGQTNRVLYIDLMASETVDEKIVESLLVKRDVASVITGDEMTQWIGGTEEQRKHARSIARKLSKKTTPGD
jgi:hypothetical protein